MGSEELRLSPRLAAIARYVIPNRAAADIGSDHAYLPVYLIETGLVPKAVAVEVNPGPYEKAREQVVLRGLARQIDVRLGDGLLPLEPGETATAIIAGMGAQTIIQILEAAPEILKNLKRLVLQPMVGADKVRSWLAANGWNLVDEDLVQEIDRIYVILVAEKGPAGSKSDKIALEIGSKLKEKRHPLLIPYLQKSIKKYRRILNGLSKSDHPDSFKKKEEIESKIIELEKVIRWLLDVKQ